MIKTGIKTRQRAIVDPSFMDLYRHVAAKWVTSIDRQIAVSEGKNRARLESMYKGDLARLRAVASGLSGAGNGIDLELAKLAKVDVERFGISEVGGDQYFVAVTRDLVMEEFARNGDTNPSNYWDSKPYVIYVKAESLGTSNLNSIHFIPKEYPWAMWRHPHHRSGVNIDKDVHPLHNGCSTCWSGFAGPVSAAMSNVDMSVLFHTLRAFVGRMYSGSFLVSPYTHREDMKWMTRRT